MTEETTTQTAAGAPASNNRITLDEPIQRPSGQTIEHVTVRKPMGGALRGISLTELLQLQTDALQKVLPRITEPPLLAQDFERMEPADLIKLGSEVIGFFVPKAERSQTA